MLASSPPGCAAAGLTAQGADRTPMQATRPSPPCRRLVPPAVGPLRPSSHPPSPAPLAPRLRKKIDALGAATRYAVHEWPGQPVPGCAMVSSDDSCSMASRRGALARRRQRTWPGFPDGARAGEAPCGWTQPLLRTGLLRSTRPPRQPTRSGLRRSANSSLLGAGSPRRSPLGRRG
jgi:hypothetical protein